MKTISWYTLRLSPPTLEGLVAASKRLAPITALGVILLLGLLVRLYGLTTTSIDQIETYVPGIQFPAASGFLTRLTLRDTFVGIMVFDEPNPPGFYFMMLGWTRMFGTGILALRLPAVFFGIGSIILIYVLAGLEHNKWTGLLAASFLALNGYHIYWSRIAKMYAMGCFLGLLATVLLVLAFRRGPRQRLFQVLYMAAALAGLATVVHFWFLFLAHILWAAWGALTKRTARPGLLRLQLIVFVLASPILALAVFQGGRPSYLSPNPLPDLLQYLQFGSLFVPDDYVTPWITIPIAASALVLIIGLSLLAVGVFAPKRQVEDEGTEILDPSRAVVALAAVLSLALILRFAKFTYGMDPARTKLVLACGLVPVFLFAADWMLRRYWRNVRDAMALDRRLTKLPFSVSSSALLAVFPVTLIAIISPVMPLLAPRTVLLFTPYLLIVISAGLATLIRRTKFSLFLLPVLGAILLYSVVWNEYYVYEQAPDFKSVAEQLIPKIGDSDLIFITPSYETNPIFYYLQGSRYHFVGGKYLEQIQQHPKARVWVLSSWQVPMGGAMRDALRGYQVQETLSALRVQAALYTPGP